MGFREPAKLTRQSRTSTILTITNQDPTPEEFDSSALQIGANQYGTARLRPLGPGRYLFMGEYEYNATTAQGVVVSA